VNLIAEHNQTLQEIEMEEMEDIKEAKDDPARIRSEVEFALQAFESHQPSTDGLRHKQADVG
jgi:hypothetical protein